MRRWELAHLTLWASAAVGTTGAVSAGGCTAGPRDGRDTASSGVEPGLTTDPGGDEANDGLGSFDLGEGSGDRADDGGSLGEGCDKVDFLFVIDSSGSMGDNQLALIASFPGFISAIQDTLVDAQDYHIMVVDTDDRWGGACAPACPVFGNCPNNPFYPCDSGQPSPCDSTIGAGINFNMDDEAEHRPCQFTTGKRYMTADEPDLGDAFRCAAHVGTNGLGDEKPMASLVAAVGDQLSAPGACNEGFLRDDAILVVTVITDEEDIDSNGTPPGWFANLVAAKDGDETAIVMLGLVNDGDTPEPQCPAGVELAPRLVSFLEMFPNRIRGSVCGVEYSSFFQQAVDLIDTTCREFIPPQG